MEVSGRRFMVHGTSQVVVQSVAKFSDCIPVVLPGLSDLYDCQELASRLDGLVLPGGRANVEPHHFDGPPFPDDEPIDPGRDGTVLPLVRACIEQQVPIFGICRGIQEMNVAMGGSLYYRIHLLEGKEDHRMPRRDDVTPEEIFRPRHRLALSGSMVDIAGSDSVVVNLSLIHI